MDVTSSDKETDEKDSIHEDSEEEEKEDKQNIPYIHPRGKEKEGMITFSRICSGTYSGTLWNIASVFKVFYFRRLE